MGTTAGKDLHGREGLGQRILSDVNKKLQVLVPGGVGFIGSHCVIELVKAGYEPIVVDNNSNSSIGELFDPSVARSSIHFHSNRMSQTSGEGHRQRNHSLQSRLFGSGQFTRGFQETFDLRRDQFCGLEIGR